MARQTDLSGSDLSKLAYKVAPQRDAPAGERWDCLRRFYDAARAYPGGRGQTFGERLAGSEDS